jgi:hypothetical protein
MRRWPVVATAVTIAALAQCRSEPINTPYCPALYTAAHGASQDLEIYPFNASAFRIALPFPLYVFTFSPAGDALYASDLDDFLGIVDPRSPRKPGLFKIELDDPVHMSPVAGSEAFSVKDLAVSSRQDKIVISAAQFGAACGIFEVGLPGPVRPIATSSSCDATAQWTYLSLSPDETRAAAVRNRHLELIDLTTGAVTEPRGGRYARGAWSPDGKWLAVIETESGNTILLDPRTFEERRVLGATDLQWSPDSAYLLARTRQLVCGIGEAGTLEAVNIATGRRTEIASSRCLIDRNTIGWVRSQVASQHRQPAVR